MVDEGGPCTNELEEDVDEGGPCTNELEEELGPGWGVGRGSEMVVVGKTDLVVTVAGGDPSDSGMMIGSSGALYMYINGCI